MRIRLPSLADLQSDTAKSILRERTLNLRKNMCLWCLLRITRTATTRKDENGRRRKNNTAQRQTKTALLGVVEVNKYIIVIRCKSSGESWLLYLALTDFGGQNRNARANVLVHGRQKKRWQSEASYQIWMYVGVVTWTVYESVNATLENCTSNCCFLYPPDSHTNAMAYNAIEEDRTSSWATRWLYSYIVEGGSRGSLPFTLAPLHAHVSLTQFSFTLGARRHCSLLSGCRIFLLSFPFSSQFSCLLDTEMKVVSLARQYNGIFSG